MDILQMLGPYAVIVAVVIPCIGLLIQYLIIRTAVARGLRDHQMWMEKNRPYGVSPQADQRPPRI